jgi:hypothetical protein
MSADNEAVERRLEDALAELAATTAFQDDAWDRITRRRGRRISARWLGGGAIAVAAAAAIAFTFAITIDDDPSRVSTTPTTTTAPPDKSCPFTAEQVSEVIGETITGPESPTLCLFGEYFPGVLFKYLDASACTQASLREADGGAYSDAVDGLGVDAYSHPAGLGVSLIVCNGDQPFEVGVEGVQGDDLPVVVALAKLVLNG